MMANDQNTWMADTARNCALLLERCAEKYGCEELPRLKRGARVAGGRALPVTAADLAKVRAEGLMVYVTPPAPSVAKKKPMRSVFDKRAPRGGRGISPAMAAAVRECLWEEKRTGANRKPGLFKRVAAKHRVHYGTMMHRLCLERELIKQRSNRRAA